jgi:phosphate-selective porin OprO and OprP
MNRRTLAFLLAAGIAVGGGGSARAQDVGTEVRIEKLERQNQDLLQTLQQMQSTPASPALASPAANSPQASSPTEAELKKMVAASLQEQDAKKKADADAAKAKAQDEGYKVGTELNMTASWKNGLWFSTPNNDFTMHIGGLVQYDNVFFSESPGLLIPAGARPGAKQGVASGVAMGGIGDLEDGSFFRRIRLQTDGTFLESYEYLLILAMENNQFSTIGMADFWVGAKDIPLIGTARLGHVKNAIGFEADMTSSPSCLTFMERSSYSEAIELNQNYVTGLWLGNNYWDERATWTFTTFRADQGGFSGAFFGDGQYGMQGRLTALPIWEDDGRCWMHVGLSGGWRGNSKNIATSPLRTIQIQARPELRDDDPASNPAGAQAVPNANDGRLVSTGIIAANSDWLLGLEYCWVVGPFSVQAEYGFNWVEDATGINPAGLKLQPALTSPQNYCFSGGYVQLAYTLTGENRAYEKRLGRLAGDYFGRQGPFNNAWFVRGDDGCYTFNCGAWEIAARYSYLNLNDGVGLNRIQGGVMDGFTMGLNWYLNANVRFQFDYVYDQRSDLPAGAISGSVRGLGMRMQFMF